LPELYGNAEKGTMNRQASAILLSFVVVAAIVRAAVGG